MGPVGPCAAPPPAESDVAYVALPPRAPPSDAFLPARAQTPGSAAPVRRTATCWCSGAGDAPPPRRGARSDLDRRAASWAHGGLDGFNGTWGSRQSGCCSLCPPRCPACVPTQLRVRRASPALGGSAHPPAVLCSPPDAAAGAGRPEPQPEMSSSKVFNFGMAKISAEIFLEIST